MARSELEPLNGFGEAYRHDALRQAGLQPPAPNFAPRRDNPLCASGWEMADDLQPVVPGIARAIRHQVGALEAEAIREHQARVAADDELVGEIRRMLERAALILARQPHDLKLRESLEVERTPRRTLFAQSAAVLGVTLDPKTITLASVMAALSVEEDYGPRPVPVPGGAGRADRIGRAVARFVAPVFCSIPISLALGTLTGMIPLSTLQDLDNLSTTARILLVLFWLMGTCFHIVLMQNAKPIGQLLAVAKNEGRIPESPASVSQKRSALVGVAVLIALWVLTSLLEGIGLRQMAMEFAYLSNETPPPLWVFLLIGSAINGAVISFSVYTSYADGCRELANGWPWKREVGVRPAAGPDEIAARRNLMASASELIDLDARLAEIDGRLREDKAALGERPQVSARALGRIAEARNAADREAARLRELMEYAARRIGILPPRVAMDRVDVPTKLVLFPFGRLWLRGNDRDEWPEP